jgi:ribosomal protein L36
LYAINCDHGAALRGCQFVRRRLRSIALTASTPRFKLRADAAAPQARTGLPACRTG